MRLFKKSKKRDNFSYENIKRVKYCKTKTPPEDCAMLDKDTSYGHLEISSVVS